MRILVAEDERITRRSLQRQLESWGHDVVAAEDGAIAWVQFQQQQFDIVVTDWDMPNVDGQELIERIRGGNDVGYAYLIMLTARSEKSDLIRGMEAGADDFLPKPFDREELRVRLRAGQRIIELERNLAARNSELQGANEKMTRDLEAAARIQQSLMPNEAPDTPQARFDWRYWPCDELAGDALNVFYLDPNHLGVYLLDVSGHGVPSSLLSVTVARAMAPSNDPSSVVRASGEGSAIAAPSDVAARLNRLFPMEDNGRHYFTMHYGILDLRTCEYTYTSPGHPGPILVTEADGAESLDLYDLPIGIVEDAAYEERTIQLPPGSRLYIHSDGLNEEKNADDAQFGRQKLRQSLAALADKSLPRALDMLLEQLRQWRGGPSFTDDISVIAMEINA